MAGRYGGKVPVVRMSFGVGMMASSGGPCCRRGQDVVGLLCIQRLAVECIDQL